MGARNSKAGGKVQGVSASHVVQTHMGAWAVKDLAKIAKKAGIPSSGVLDANRWQVFLKDERDWIRKHDCVELVKAWIKVSKDVGKTKHSEIWNGKYYMYTDIPLSKETDDDDDDSPSAALMHTMTHAMAITAHSQPPPYPQGAVGGQEHFTRTKDGWVCSNINCRGVNRNCESVCTQCCTRPPEHHLPSAPADVPTTSPLLN